MADVVTLHGGRELPSDCELPSDLQRDDVLKSYDIAIMAKRIEVLERERDDAIHERNVIREQLRKMAIRYANAVDGV